MIKPMLFGALGFGLAASLAGAGYYVGQDAAAIPIASPFDTRPVKVELSKPKAHDDAAQIIGVWALADDGCATGYGAGYSDDGRFSEGDEFSGVEGRWRVSGRTLIRETVLRYETGDDSDTPKAQPLHQIDRFPILRSTGSEFVIQDRSRKFSYVKCPEGRRILLDGGKIE